MRGKVLGNRLEITVGFAANDRAFHTGAGPKSRFETAKQ